MSNFEGTDQSFLIWSKSSIAARCEVYIKTFKSKQITAKSLELDSNMLGFMMYLKLTHFYAQYPYPFLIQY
jgi:hypothetical protein